MKKFLFILTVISMMFYFSSCEQQTGTDKGTISLSLTDSPVDGSNVTGVYITINEIQVHTPDSGWISMENFKSPQKYDLLDLTRGESELLGNIEVDGGKYTQVRFLLDAPADGTSKPSNPGCYIEFQDGTTQPLFVPSGSQSGFKGIGSFDVPVNGTVEITADFDVRKSVNKTGSASPRYILRPVIRLVVNNQAGTIRGSVTNIPVNTGIVLYAYADGTYKTEEANDPASETSVRFPNAVSSDKTDANGIYHISYLASGKYDLVVTSLNGDTFGSVLGIIQDVIVESNKTTTQNIDISALK